MYIKDDAYKNLLYFIFKYFQLSVLRNPTLSNGIDDFM